jgi:hypothetical protein
MIPRFYGAIVDDDPGRLTITTKRDVPATQGAAV